MNVDGLIRMLFRMFMRRGMKHLAKRAGGNNDPRLKNAKRAAKVARRAGRM